MARRFRVYLDEHIIKTAQRHYLTRKMRIPIFCVTLPFCALTILSGFLFNDSFFFMIAGGIALFLIILIPTRYLIATRRTIAMVRKLEGGEIEYTIEGEKLSVTSAVGKSELRADMFRGVWQFTSIWLILLRYQDGFLVIPTECLSDEDKSALLSFCNM